MVLKSSLTSVSKSSWILRSLTKSQTWRLIPIRIREARDTGAAEGGRHAERKSQREGQGEEEMRAWLQASSGEMEPQAACPYSPKWAWKNGPGRRTSLQALGNRHPSEHFYRGN